VTNHLWESTLFAAVVAALALVFRKNAARVRHWLWLAASVKFLIPFSLLISLGSQVHWRTAVPDRLPMFVQEFSQQFSAPEVQFASSAPQPIPWTAIGGAAWLAGCVVLALIWFVRWWRVRSAVLGASPLWLDTPIAAKSSPMLLEPGVFGIWRPVLLLPEGITERLTAEQLDAVVAHELCHVRRRDNLAAAIHMVVEALFWFHPLVWWIGARMVEERERACDEEVLRLGKEPEVYAESILKVCRLYLESPVECVAGVTGSDLKKRIEGIMMPRSADALDFGRRALLASVGIIAVSAPVAIGVINAPRMQAQSKPTTRLAFEVVSVKPSAPDDRRSPGHSFLPGGRFTARKLPPRALIRLAYDLPYILISGGPSWLESENFDIDAKADDPSSNSQQMRRMLQSLLADRFKVEVRRETKEMPVYALVVAKGGPKLKKAEDRTCEETLGMDAFLRHTLCHWILGGPGPGLSGSTVNMRDLAEGLTARLGRPVLDNTGIEGNFDIKTSGWNPGFDISEGREPPADPNAPTLFAVIEEQLGLKLESRKAPVETLVIERAERPSQN